MNLELFKGLLAEPAWLQIWVLWLILVNSAAILFLRREAARWVLGAWVANVLLMNILAEMNGYNRFLGFSHVVTWTPLLVLLFRRYRNAHEFAGTGVFDRWIRILFVTNLTSLVVDCVDVARYLVGTP